MGQGMTKEMWRRVALREQTRAHLTSQALQDLVAALDEAAQSRAPARAVRVLRLSQVMERARRPLDIQVQSAKCRVQS